MNSNVPPAVRRLPAFEYPPLSSEGRGSWPLFFEGQISVAQFELHIVPGGEHLADLQESLVLCLRDHQPDVDQREQTDDGKDDEAIGAQTSLGEEGEKS